MDSTQISIYHYGGNDESQASNTMYMAQTTLARLERVFFSVIDSKAAIKNTISAVVHISACIARTGTSKWHGMRYLSAVCFRSCVPYQYFSSFVSPSSNFLTLNIFLLPKDLGRWSQIVIDFYSLFGSVISGRRYNAQTCLPTQHFLLIQCIHPMMATSPGLEELRQEPSLQGLP